jgi:lactate permease
MLLALYQQKLDPLDLPWLSTLLAALPVLVLFVLLVPLRWLAPKAALGGAVTAFLVAITAFGMPWEMASMSFLHGVGFGLLPTGWNILTTMLLYNISVETGQFAIIRRSVAGISADARLQAILIGFSFGAFLEGSAGGGTPVAICGAIMMGLGFKPFQAAVLCLIANTSPVAYGGLGTPIIVLNGVTDIPCETISVMAGHQLPFLSVLIPLWMVKCMCSWRQTLEVLPALFCAGGSFALFQYTFATFHVHFPQAGLVLWPMTDIGGGIFSLVSTALFLRFWQPRTLLRHETTATPADEPPLTAWTVAKAWAPFALMSLLLLSTGLLRQQEQERTLHKQGPIWLGPLQTEYAFPLPAVDGQVYRDTRLLLPGTEAKPEAAVYKLPWLSVPGTAVLGAALVSMLLLRMTGRQMKAVLGRTCQQMKIPIPTIALMLGLSYLTRYSGMDATLGYAFAATGVFYPFFAALLGWLGVFLTGTDAGSNALFGSLQKITATEIYQQHPELFSHLTLPQTQTLICTANSTGGVMGKMIDAQSICVATAATNQLGQEADIFKAVVWHSIILAAIVGGLTALQAYVWPLTLLVPK